MGDFIGNRSGEGRLELEAAKDDSRKEEEGVNWEPEAAKVDWGGKKKKKQRLIGELMEGLIGEQKKQGNWGRGWLENIGGDGWLRNEGGDWREQLWW